MRLYISDDLKEPNLKKTTPLDWTNWTFYIELKSVKNKTIAHVYKIVTQGFLIFDYV